MAYEEWMPEFQELWENTPGTSELSGAELDWAEFVFEEGFMTFRGERTPDEIEEARTMFFDVIGWEYEAFDWQGWREAMGYE